MQTYLIPIETPAGYSHPRAECPFCQRGLTFIGSAEWAIGKCGHYAGYIRQAGRTLARFTLSLAF